MLFKLERDTASDIWGLRGIILLLLNLIKLQNSDLVALNEFVKNVVVCSQINNLNAPLSNFVSLTYESLVVIPVQNLNLEVVKNNRVKSFKKLAKQFTM